MSWQDRYDNDMAGFEEDQGEREERLGDELDALRLYNGRGCRRDGGDVRPPASFHFPTLGAFVQRRLPDAEKG